MTRKTIEKKRLLLAENERRHQQMMKAAPELLEACKAALEYVEGSIEHETDLSEAAEVRDKLKDVIRFATNTAD